MLESKIQKEILHYLRHKRVFNFRFQAQSNLNGVPDIICVYKGLFLGLELKQEKGKATELQKRKLDVINNAGGIGLIIKSVDEVELLFKMLDENERELLGEMTTDTFIKLYEDNRKRLNYERYKEIKK